MQEQNLNITIGPVNQGGEGFQVGFESGNAVSSDYLFSAGGCKGYMHPSMINVRVLHWQEFKGGKLTGDTVVELPKCTGRSVSYEGIGTAESFDKWVTIQVSPNKKPTASEILKNALKETMEEMKPATTGICSLEDVEFKTMGIDPMKDRVSYKIVGWTSDKKHRELKSGFITGSIESEATKEMLAKRININDIAFAVIDEGYQTKAVRDFAALHKIKVATMRLTSKTQQTDRYDDCFILASNAADKVIKSNKKMTDEERAKEETKNPVLGGLFDRIKENQAKRKAEDLWLKNTSVFSFNIELNYFDVLKEIKKPNSAAIVCVSNDDGEFSLSLSEFVSAYFKEGLELCDSAVKLENALTTLSKAKDTEDDYLITCAELAVEESRDEVAFWSEGFKLLHSTNKCE